MKAKSIIVVVLAAVLLASCGSEFKLAKSFTTQAQQTRVAVYFPETVQVTLLPDGEGDYSEVLDSVNQNMFLDIMYAAYADGLRHCGMDVYIPEDQDHIQIDSTHWLVILSNMEIQGMYSDYVDRLFDFLSEYEYTFALNTVNVASWFDINDGQWHPTVFDEHNLRDDFDSYITHSRETGTQYHYNITPLKAADVYNYAVYLGKRYAEFTYDYMMNRYIDSSLEKRNVYPRFRLHWDSTENSYNYLMDDEGFIEVRTEN